MSKPACTPVPFPFDLVQRAADHRQHIVHRAFAFALVYDVQMRPDAIVVKQVCDMSDLESIEPALDIALASARQLRCQVVAGSSSSTTSAVFDRVIVVNNSASLGEMNSLYKLGSLQHLRSTMDMNLTACIWFTTLMLRRIPGLVLPAQSSTITAGHTYESLPCVIINISSLTAIKPFKTLLPYCIHKAARDMLHTGLAEELNDPSHNPLNDASLSSAQRALQLSSAPAAALTGTASSATSASAPSHHPAIKTLNYAPGPMDTDMSTAIAECSGVDGPTREWYVKAKADGSNVDPFVSAAKCTRLIQANKFVSGSHIDFYDAEP